MKCVHLREQPAARPLPEPLRERHQHQRGAEREEGGRDDIARPVRTRVDARVTHERREPETPRGAFAKKQSATSAAEKQFIVCDEGNERPSTSSRSTRDTFTFAGLNSASMRGDALARSTMRTSFIA